MKWILLENKSHVWNHQPDWNFFCSPPSPSDLHVSQWAPQLRSLYSIHRPDGTFIGPSLEPSSQVRFRNTIFWRLGVFFSSVLAPQKGSKRLTISPLWVESPGRASNFQLLDTPISHVRDEATNAPLVSWRTLPTALQVSMRRPRFQRSCSSSVLPRIPPPMTAATSTVTSSWIEKQIKRRNLGTPDDVNDFKPGRKTWSSPEACGNTPNSLFVKDRVKFEQGPCVNGLMYACVYRYIYIYISVSVCVSIYLSIYLI